jgi:ssDNA-binding Zn-finger/Zn-ribbon topoisomerase 1
MSTNCPTCGQTWPAKKKRQCARCGKPIGRHDKWAFVGAQCAHKDCDNPTLDASKAAPVAQPVLYGGDVCQTV